MNNYNWKKIKFSTSFRRKITKNFKRILNSEPKFSFEKNAHVLEQISSKKQRPERTVQTKVYDHIYTATVPYDESLEESEERANNDSNNKWLVELSDDNFSDYEEQDSLEQGKNERLRNDFRKWACEFNITQRALKEVIKIVNERLPYILPTDPRTLLGTPTTISIQQMGDGYYWHQGLEACLKKSQDSLQTISNISLNVNIDGLPIYKSSKDEFWPILFNIFELPELQPMAIGIYSGKGKPSNVEEFLTPFVEETKLILENGIAFENGHIIQVKIRSFISDSPARAFIKAGHSSENKNVCIWDSILPHNKALVMAFTCHDQGASSLVFAPQHQVLISAGKKGDVCLIDVRMKGIRHKFGAHESAVKCIAIDPHEDFFATGSADGDIKIWGVAVPNVLLSLPAEHARSSFFKNIGQGVTQLQIDSHSKLFSCGADGSMKVRQLPDRDTLLNHH